MGRVKSPIKRLKDNTLAGICRVCGCTYEDGCPEGCGWADRPRTICTVCVELDERARKRRRREAIGELRQRLFCAHHEVNDLRARINVLE
jgi:hypothetical protein